MSEHLPTPQPERQPDAAEAYIEALRVDAQVDLIDNLLHHSDKLVWLRRHDEDRLLIQGGVTVESLHLIRDELTGKPEAERE